MEKEDTGINKYDYKDQIWRRLKVEFQESTTEGRPRTDVAVCGGQRLLIMYSPKASRFNHRSSYGRYGSRQPNIREVGLSDYLRTVVLQYMPEAKRLATFWVWLGKLFFFVKILMAPALVDKEVD